ncbi:ATP-binding protein [Streptomyces sp. 900105245]
MVGDDVLMRLDEGGRVLEWQRAAEEMFGWSAEDTVGQSVAALVRGAATDGPVGRSRLDETHAVLVRPLLTGERLVWDVRRAADAASGEDMAILRAMFTQSPVGLHVLDEHLRIVRMNTATRALRGTAVGRLRGRLFTEAYGIAAPEAEEAAIGTSLLAREVLAPSAPLRPLFDGSAGRPLNELCDAVAYAVDHGRPAGDALLLFARTTALPAGQVFTCPLPAEAEAAPFARAAVRRRLREWGVDQETSFVTELIVSELVGNAVRYGAPPFRLRLILNGVLTCEVTDAAAAAPHIRHARASDETGRGLFIVATLADAWGMRYLPVGKTVWAQQSVGDGTGGTDGTGGKGDAAAQ